MSRERVTGLQQEHTRIQYSVSFLSLEGTAGFVGVEEALARKPGSRQPRSHIREPRLQVRSKAPAHPWA